jgi:hypothetical protein
MNLVEKNVGTPAILANALRNTYILGHGFFISSLGKWLLSQKMTKIQLITNHLSQHS